MKPWRAARQQRDLSSQATVVNALRRSLNVRSRFQQIPRKPGKTPGRGGIRGMGAATGGKCAQNADCALEIYPPCEPGQLSQGVSNSTEGLGGKERKF